jgi:ankyrin repeat protein
LDNGADVNVRGNDGESALSLAQKRGNTTVVQLLLNRNSMGSKSGATVQERVLEVQK